MTPSGSFNANLRIETCDYSAFCSTHINQCTFIPYAMHKNMYYTLQSSHILGLSDDVNDIFLKEHLHGLLV